MRRREIRVCFLKVLLSEVILFYIFENYFRLRNFFSSKAAEIVAPAVIAKKNELDL